MKITSRQNQKIAHFRALMRERKARLEAGEFAVEGEKLFHEAVSSGLKPANLLITKNFYNKNNNFYEYVVNLCNIDIISDDLGEYISDTKSPQGVFFTLPLLAEDVALDKFLNMTTIYNSSDNKKLIILDGVGDPGNVGTVIRSCDAFGIAGLVLSANCADIHSPKVIRSAMGSAFRLPILKGKLTVILPQIKEKGFVVIGATLNVHSQNLKNFMFPERCAVIIGSEGAGISMGVLEYCDNEIYIPIKNAESLNAAVAASIIAYEIFK